MSGFSKNPPKLETLQKGAGGWLREGVGLRGALCWPTAAIDTEGEVQGHSEAGKCWFSAALTVSRRE